ncbi:ribokinase [Bosea robiniae]|uniref:Ribokinase n=1 Tax=Bosea robiniae TaxID=1036780 RepID=A0ABY0P0V5_9HYPH|nr:ribokinase [Bosea robiniae]
MLTASTTLVLQMEVPFAQSLALAQRVQRSGGRVIWNCAPVPDGFSAAAASALLAASEVLVVNEHEAADIAAILEQPSTGPGGLSRSTATNCIVTASAEGAFAYTPAGETIHVPAPRIEPVDTTGAGDTFVGAVAMALDEGLELAQALDLGCRAAATTCLAQGAQAGMPLRRF